MSVRLLEPEYQQIKPKPRESPAQWSGKIAVSSR